MYDHEPRSLSGLARHVKTKWLPGPDGGTGAVELPPVSRGLPSTQRIRIRVRMVL